MAELLFESYYGVSNMEDDVITHHGIKGQKWGTRRWQNEDGSLTPAGREHYGVSKITRGSIKRSLNRADNLRSDAQYVINRSKKKSAKLQEKLKKRIAKTEEREGGATERDEKKIAKLKTKISKERNTQKAARRTQAELNESIKRTIKLANKNGLSVKSRDVYKDAEETRHLLAQFLGGTGAQVISRLASDSVVTGRKYSVKKTKDGQKATYEHDSRSASRLGAYGNYEKTKMKGRMLSGAVNAGIASSYALAKGMSNYSKAQREKELDKIRNRFDAAAGLDAVSEIVNNTATSAEERRKRRRNIG